MNDPTRERTEGPTPAGGTHAIAYFRDAKGAPTTKERAVAVEIVEFGASGEAIMRTYMEKPAVDPDVARRLGIAPP